MDKIAQNNEQDFLSLAIDEANNNHYSLACKCLNYLMVRASDEDIKQVLATGRITSKVLPKAHAPLFDIWLNFIKSEPNSLKFTDFKDFCSNRAFKIDDNLLAVEYGGLGSVYALSDKWILLEQACITCRALTFHAKQINDLKKGNNPSLKSVDEYSKALVLDSVIKPISAQDFISIVDINLNNQLNPEAIIVPTYYTYLDEITGGMRKGDLTVFGARPGTGKTLLALNVILNHFKANKANKIAFFSAEMTKASLVDRFFYGAINSYTVNGIACPINMTFADVKGKSLAKVDASKRVFTDFI